MTRLLRFFCCSLFGILLQVGSVYAQVAPGPSLYNPNVWIGQQSSPPCVLTNGATVSVNALSCTTSPGGDGVDLNTLTLTQNSTFAFPAGLPVKGNFKFGFRINHGTGPYTAQFASGYQFPNASLTNGQPTLSTSGTDYVWCVSEEGSSPTIVDCNASMLAMTPVSTSSLARISGAVGTPTASGVTATVTVSATAGVKNAYLCLVHNEGSATPPTGVSDGTNVLTKLTENVGGDATDQSVWGKVNLTGSSTTMTATWAGTETFTQISCDWFSGITSIGAVTNPPNFQSHPGAGANVITSATVVVANGNLLWGATDSVGATPGTTGSTATAIGTGFSAGFHDTTASRWGAISEYAFVSGGTPTVTTFTDANGASEYYLTNAVVLQ